jgi:nucleotide-binding universal stress UspA family protein
MKKVLITLDDGAAAEKIATAGFELGKQLNAEIAIVSVVDPTFLSTGGSITPKQMEEIVRDDFKKTQQKLIDKVFQNYSVTTFVEIGNPYEEILKKAEEWNADLIVLGTHGRTGLTHLLMGSVAEKVIRHSIKPLYVIPMK